MTTAEMTTAETSTATSLAPPLTPPPLADLPSPTVIPPSWHELPHTAHLRPIPTRLLGAARRPGMWLLRRWWRIEVHDQHRVPSHGPVILAANHLGAVDGPILVGATPRPAVALAKQELFAGRLGTALNLVGQIPVNRHVTDPWALRRAVQALRAGMPMVIFPEGVRAGGEVATTLGGWAYLAMVTGAPVIPVAILGTRLSGTPRTSVPRRGSRVAVVFGEPISVPQVPWPRRRADVGIWNETLRVALGAHVRAAVQRTGLALPHDPA